jgi:DNA-binding LacI/PurR family transcriptional regulator
MARRFRYWSLRTFPEITRDWFERNSSSRVDPQRAFRQWNKWLAAGRRPRVDEEKFKTILRSAGGVGPASVSHYLSQERDPGSNFADKLSIKTRRDLDAICVALGRPPLYPTTGSVAPSARSDRKLILLAQLGGIPSPRYHLQVIQSLAEAGERYGFSVAIHHVPSNPEDQRARLNRALHSTVPHGVIWFRLSPDPDSLAAIREYSDSLPVVIVHGNRLSYPAPVIAHIVPAHELVPPIVEMWCRGLPALRNGNRSASQKVVVLAMCPEDCGGSVPRSNPQIPISIREDRILRVEAGVREAGLHPIVDYVPDYSASQAFPAWQKHAPCRGWAVLSDELAVGLMQLLAATGTSPREAARRVLGFDGSEFARNHGVASLDQHLYEIGDRTIGEFSRFHDRVRNADEPFPAFHELPVTVSLTPGL